MTCLCWTVSAYSLFLLTKLQTQLFSLERRVTHRAIIMWPAVRTKGALSRWGQFELEAKKWGTITMSSTCLSYFNWPEKLYLLSYMLDSNIKSHCILGTFLLYNITKVIKIDWWSLFTDIQQHDIDRYWSENKHWVKEWRLAETQFIWSSLLAWLCSSFEDSLVMFFLIYIDIFTSDWNVISMWKIYFFLCCLTRRLFELPFPEYMIPYFKQVRMSCHSIVNDMLNPT